MAGSVPFGEGRGSTRRAAEELPPITSPRERKRPRSRDHGYSRRRNGWPSCAASRCEVLPPGGLQAQRPLAIRNVERRPSRITKERRAGPEEVRAQNGVSAQLSARGLRRSASVTLGATSTLPSANRSRVSSISEARSKNWAPLVSDAPAGPETKGNCAVEIYARLLMCILGPAGARGALSSRKRVSWRRSLSSR